MVSLILFGDLVLVIKRCRSQDKEPSYHRQLGRSYLPVYKIIDHLNPENDKT